MIAVHGETYELKRYPRKEDSPYEFSEIPDLVFYGRPANQAEKRNYRIQQGVEGNNSGMYIICTNLPDNLKPKDKIVLLGKEWIVNSTGYYFDQALIANANVFSDEYIIERCPKGLTLA